MTTYILTCWYVLNIAVGMMTIEGMEMFSQQMFTEMEQINVYKDGIESE